MSISVWGSNKSGQLINRQKNLHCYKPTVADTELGCEVPIQVACGEGHTLVLCESGDVFSFGRGREGQLGRTANQSTKKVENLENHIIVGVAAGSLTSYAVTSTGKVYHWGLIHQDGTDPHSTHPPPAEGEDVTAGQLPGLAQDQDLVVEVDVEARAAQGQTDTRARRLQDIVRGSTDQWQLPTADADREYFDELRSMGYQVEELEEKMQQRGREYHGMLRMECKRIPLNVPRIIKKLDNIRVVAVSAGYAHTMLLSDRGHLYAAGYNDRGQLGLGHRINTSEFKHIDFLSNKFVFQVVCGQQHTICRALDIPVREPNQEENSKNRFFVGSSIGADAFVWGNGILGQLGLGIRGTSKGRLLPKLIDGLFESHPKGICDVGAGANFTVAVTIDGKVYSFGHAEYNQHGTGNRSYQDYIDPFYFFVPRLVKIESATRGPKTGLHAWGKYSRLALERGGYSENSQEVKITKVSCGSNFSVGIDQAGDLYSWGWNESGVLGQGMHHFSSEPTRVEGVGTSCNGCPLKSVAAGTSHVVALSDIRGCVWANSFQNVLEGLNEKDCVVVVEPPSGKTSKGLKTRFPCHRAMLAARSQYLRGFISNAELEFRNCELELHLPSGAANPVTVKCLLEYLYLDRIQVPHHKQLEMLKLAEDLHIEPLFNFLSDERTSSKQPHNNPVHPLIALLHPKGEAPVEKDFKQISMEIDGFSSTFLSDMVQLFDNPTHADIVFVSKFSSDSPSFQADEVLNPENFDFILHAHKFIINDRLPYFEALLHSPFADSANYVKLRKISNPLLNLLNPEKEDETTLKNVLQIDISGFLREGIDVETFKSVVMYAYTGHLYQINTEGELISIEDDLQQIMALLVAANQFGFISLEQRCERTLSFHLGDFFPENAISCLNFSRDFNLPRLERQCLELLEGTDCILK